jgi:preprotein translocase subunit SecG
MNNSVRNEAQRFGILVIVAAVVVLVVFFFLSKSGLGSAGSGGADVTSGSSTMQSPVGPPSPAAT